MLWASILPLAASELQGEASVNVGLGLSRRWTLTVYQRGRMRLSEAQWFDVSTVPRLRASLGSRVSLELGHFVTKLRDSRGDWHTVNRPYAGPEILLWRHESWRITSRALYERFLVSQGKDYNRYRTRLQLDKRTKPYHPFASAEWFFDAHGVRSTRYRAGLRRDLGRHHGIEGSYWYETRAVTGPGLRHMFTVTLHLYFPGLAPDT